MVIGTNQASELVKRLGGIVYELGLVAGIVIATALLAMYSSQAINSTFENMLDLPVYP